MASTLKKPALVAVADKFIIAAREGLEFVGAFTTDISAETLSKKVKTIAVSVISSNASVFNASTNNYENAAGSDIPAYLSFGAPVKATHCIDEIDQLEVETSGKFEQYAKADGAAVAAALKSSVCSLLTDAGAVSTINADCSTLEGIAAVKTALEAQKVNAATVVLLLTPAKFNTLLTKLNVSITGDMTIIKAGRIMGQMLGFKAIVNCGGYLASSVTAEGFAVPEDAVIVGARHVEPVLSGEGLVDHGTITDEVTGLTVDVRVHVNNAKGEAYINTVGSIGAALTKQTIDSTPNGAPGYWAIKATV